MKKTLVKVCGLTNLDDAKLALELGADALGFNFYKRSARYIEPAEAQSIVRSLPARAWMVGIFVNHDVSEVKQIARLVGLDTLQFHGEESIEYLAGWDEWRVMKAVRLGGSKPRSELESIRERADFLLYDRFDDSMFGGTGKEIEQDELESSEVKRFLHESFLSGGLTPENVAEKIKKHQPYGVDVASGVEVSPGVKGAALMEQFIAAAKAESR